MPLPMKAFAQLYRSLPAGTPPETLHIAAYAMEKGLPQEHALLVAHSFPGPEDETETPMDAQQGDPLEEATELPQEPPGEAPPPESLQSTLARLLKDPEDAPAAKGAAYLLLGKDGDEWNQRMLLDGISQGQLGKIRQRAEALLTQGASSLT